MTKSRAEAFVGRIEFKPVIKVGRIVFKGVPVGGKAEAKD